MRKVITLDEASDIMTTAIEGGIGYWSQADQIRRDEELNYLGFRLHDANCAEGDEPEFPPTVVTRQMVKAAWRKIANEKPLRSDLMEQMHDCTVEPGDAGAVDADVADCIIQVAVLGVVVFG